MFNFFFDLKNLGREKEVRKGEYPQFTKSISRIREVTSRNRYYHLCLPDDPMLGIGQQQDVVGKREVIGPSLNLSVEPAVKP